MANLKVERVVDRFGAVVCIGEALIENVGVCEAIHTAAAAVASVAAAASPMHLCVARLANDVQSAMRWRFKDRKPHLVDAEAIAPMLGEKVEMLPLEANARIFRASQLLADEHRLQIGRQRGARLRRRCSVQLGCESRC